MDKLSADERTARSIKKAYAKLVRRMVKIVKDPKSENSDVIAAGRLLLMSLKTTEADGDFSLADTLQQRRGKVSRAREQAPMSLEEIEARIDDYMQRALGQELYGQYKSRKANETAHLQPIEPEQPKEITKAMPKEEAAPIQQKAEPLKEKVTSPEGLEDPNFHLRIIRPSYLV